MSKRRNQRGEVLLFALMFAALLLISIGSLINYVTLESRAQRRAVASAQALALAEAGVDQAVYELNAEGDYTGETNSSLPTGTFVTTVGTINANTKTITSTGYVPNMTSPIAVRTVEVTVSIDTSVISFNSGVQVGDGGLVMNNGSYIFGNVASNGPISGGGIITKTATVSGPQQGTLNQQFTTQNSSFNVGDISSHGVVAQSFQPSSSGLLSQVNLYLKEVGTPGDLSVIIVADNTGSPGTTALASATIASTSISQSYAQESATFTVPAALTASRSYWIIASSSTIDSNNYVVWGSNSSGGYGAGAAEYGSSWNPVSFWNSISGDLDFQTFMRAYGSISGVYVGGNAYAHTLSNCSVGGNAYYQTNSGCSVFGKSYPGSADPAPGLLPISNTQIAAWEQIAAGGTVIQGPYTLSSTRTLGPAEINGDLDVKGTLILSGPVWVNGNVTFENNSSLTVSSNAGSNGAILIADSPGNTATKGTVNMSNNMATIGGNGQIGSYPMVISTNSSSNAILLSNNAAGIILFASAGTVNVSNNAYANELVGYSVNLGNNSAVFYLNGLRSATFTDGPGGSWTFEPGSYVITQ